MLRSSWIEGADEDASVSVSVRARMAEMSKIVSDRELKAKQTMKKFYDRSARAKTFSAGEMVLVRKPGLHCKLGDSWEGPYQIERQVSPVTYYVQVPGKPNHSKLLHCNMLRRWTTPAIKIHRVATITEEESACETPPGLTLLREDFVPSVSEQDLLDSVLEQFEDVLSPEPGRTDVLKLSINTGVHDPVRSHPYRIPPRWKDELRVEIDKFLALGFIRPLTVHGRHPLLR